MSEEVKQAIMQFKTAINFKTATVMPMEYSIDIESAKVLLKYIEQLQQENEELKQRIKDFEKYKMTPDELVALVSNELIRENEMLNNILTEFEKWLRNGKKQEIYFYNRMLFCEFCAITLERR